MKRVFVSDCEGPISKNDNAFEITSHFVPEGDKLFTVISKYDDVLAEVGKRAGYKPGDTLKLVLPFLKAYAITDQKMREFSAENLRCIPEIRFTLQYIKSVGSAFIVSASYEHYLKTLCQALGFPFENAYCTRVSLDKYSLQEKEKEVLKRIGKEIAEMPIFEIPSEAKSLNDLPKGNRETIKDLDEIFWGTIAKMEIGRIYSDVNPVGGSEKAKAVEDIVHRSSVALMDVMYVGDSITDGEAFRLARQNGGLTVSFNGNQYAVKNAEIAVLSENSIVTAIIADVFIRFGKQNVLDLVDSWSRKALERSSVNEMLLGRFFKACSGGLPEVKMVTDDNMEALAEKSSRFRKKVRGEAIGRLG